MQATLELIHSARLNARHFAHFNGTGVLFDAPHDQSVTGYRRAKKSGKKSKDCLHQKPPLSARVDAIQFHWQR